MSELKQRLAELLAALDSPERASRVTSVRQPATLQRALRTAIEMGWAANATDGLNRALREQLDAFAQRTALDLHYAAHPQARPDLAEVALALAELDHSPVADEPELIRQAAAEVRLARPGADADDVLLWAESLRRHRRPA